MPQQLLLRLLLLLLLLRLLLRLLLLLLGVTLCLIPDKSLEVLSLPA